MTGEVIAAPLILETAWQIERFGAEALGLAPISVALSRRLSLAVSIYSGYKMRVRATDWVEFAKQNPQLQDTLVWAEQVANDVR